jgi:hypothetical protein
MSEQVGTPLRGNKSDGWESYPYLSESSSESWSV